MSFDHLSFVEAGRRSSGPGYSDDPEFQRLAGDITNKLFKLSGNNQRLSSEVTHLGTRRDTPRVRERVNELLDESRELFKEVGEAVKKVQMWDDVTPVQKYTQQKVSKEFKIHITEFQNLQRQALEKQKASVSAARTALDSEGPEGHVSAFGQDQHQHQLQQQTLSRLAPQDDVDFQEALIIEREEEIREIERGVGDLNVLFQQVASIVATQGEQLDDIQSNVTRTREDTHNADLELRAAARYQKNARSKACCLLLVLAVILTIVLLAVFLG